MNKDQCFSLGFVARLHGFKGEVAVFLDVDDPSYYKKLESVFIDLNNKLVPFSVLQYRLINKGQALVKLEGIDSEEKAKAILKKEVFLPLEKLKKLDNRRFYFHEVIGFTVIDQEKGEIGIVQDVLDSNENYLLQVMQGKVEILIPANKDLVLNVDRENKRIEIQTPEGLIDLYLEEGN